jgi:hypothetical protein
MNLRELFNLIQMIPEAGQNYIATRLAPPNELTRDEKRTLSSWITKNQRQSFSDDVRKILLMLDYKNIRWIDNPTEEEILKSIYEDPYLIEFIDEPSENAQMAAILDAKGSLGNLFNLIKNPVRSVWIEVIKDKPAAILTIDTPDLEYQLAALTVDPALIRNPTQSWLPEARRFVFNQDPQYFNFLHDPTEEECWTALNYNSQFISSIVNPSPEMRAFAIIVS